MEGKLILTGKLELLSPLLIGSGNNDSTDIDVILDSKGYPFITFTSFIGALRHSLSKNYAGINDDDINNLFGFAKDDDAKGSVFTGTDFFHSRLSKTIISTRDGIKIKLSTGIVKQGAKYDYQIVERGNEFSFNLEATYSKENKEDLLKYFATIIKLLKEKDEDGVQSGLRIGAKTNNGLGKIFLNDDKLYDYDFSKKENVIKWLKREFPEALKIPDDIKPFDRIDGDLIIDAYLDLKTSLIQRSYNDDPAMPDSSHIQTQEFEITSSGEEKIIKKNILTGSGAKGAITARARKIVNTIWKNDENSKFDFMDELFGYVYDPNDKSDNRMKKEPKKSKLQIEERELPAYAAELHARIKIDRFTGGTISGALFDSMPLFNTKDISEMNEEKDLHKKYTWLTIRVRDCSEAEAGLMLLVLKDLWTADLAIGGEKGIGRGVFDGIRAFIKFKEETVELYKELENLNSLQKYVDALTKEAGVKNVK